MKKLLLLVITATVLAYVVISIGFWLFENMFSVAGRVFHCNAHKLYVEGKGPAPNQYRVLSYLLVEHLFKRVPCVDNAAHTPSFEGELASKISLPLLLTTSSILNRFFPRNERKDGGRFGAFLKQKVWRFVYPPIFFALPLISAKQIKDSPFHRKTWI